MADEPADKPVDKPLAEMLEAVQSYTDSVKLGANHALRIVVLSHRIKVLSDIHREMCDSIAAECDTVKDMIESTNNPEPPGYREAMEHHRDLQAIQHIMEATLKEANEEKDFTDWHMAVAVLPEYEKAMKHLRKASGQ